MNTNNANQQYMMIENQGNVCIDDLRLIGSSSKRGDDTKIGQFGSGWKYALAWLIRNEATPVIFSSQEEIKIDFNYSIHRGNPVRVITINDVESSLTAEMGPQWKGWMAFREIFSNAIDEGGHSFKFGIKQEEMVKKDGVTRVYIPIVPQLFDVVKEFDTYFSFQMKPLSENRVGKMFVFDEKKIAMSYRKGIRCYESKFSECIFALDFNEIDISEDRTATEWDIRQAHKNFISCCTHKDSIKLYMKSQLSSGYKDINGSLNSTAIEAFTELTREGVKFTTQLLARLKPAAGALIIADDLYNKLVEANIIDHALSNMISGLRFVFSHDTAYASTEAEIGYYLSECFSNAKIMIGEMDDDCKYQRGEEFGAGINFYINSKKVPDMTTKELAALCLITSESCSAIAALFN